FLGPGAGVDQVVEGHGDRLRVATGEHHAEQKVVPDLGELPDQAHHDDRDRPGQQDAPEDGEEPRAIQPRRLHQGLGHAGVVVAEKQRGEGQAVHDVHQHQAGGGTGQAQLAEGERGRQQHRLERQEAAEQQQPEE
uniref:MHC class II antigen n=1 Tax=Steinernema glaseri TaxID=37863 RepID=A0A1I8AN86_9BILA